MKANSKKLLSLLMAVAMVLSLVPAISLQAEAAEFDPATTVCDACGTAPVGGWTEISASTTGVTLSTSGHYYLSGELNGSTNPMLKIEAGVTVCLHSNGQRIRQSRTASNTTKTVAINVAGTLNYMGDGTVLNRSATTTYPSVVIASGGSVKLYGGTFYNFDPSAYVASGYAVTGQGSDTNGNTWTVGKLVGPDLPTTCPGCGEPVTEWKPVTAATGTKDWANGSGHFYLTKDLTGGGKRVMQFIAADEVCLHLNGHSITSTYTGGSGIAVRSYGTLRIMGEGTISAGTDTAAMGAVVAYGGTVEIYGGTYVDSTSEAPVRENGGNAVIYGGNFCDSVSAFVAEGYEQTENADGSYTVSKIEAPTITADCPHCDEENIEWLPFTGGFIGVAGDTKYYHYYLPEEVESTATYAIQNNNEGANAVLYLNGQDLEFTGRIRTRASGSLYIFGDGNVIRKDNADSTGSMMQANTTPIYISGGNFINNDTDAPMFEDENFVITGGSFNENPSEFVPDGYRATEENGVWTVSAYVAPPYPTDCPMCGAENVTWTEVSGPTGDTGFATSGHYILVDNIVGTAKRVFNVPADKEVCLYLNNWNITGTSDTNGPAALQTLGTLRVGGEGVVSTPNVTPNAEGKVSWGVITANGEDAVVEIYGGTYIDGAGRNQAVRSTGTMTIYGGSFSNEVTGFVADNKWCLPKDDLWHVEDLTAAAVVTKSGYTTYETTEAAVAAYTEGYILMGSADSIELTKAAVVDSNDKENVVVTGEGVLSPVGGGSWDLTNANVNRDATNPVTGVRYLTVENNTYKFDMKISKVVLRPGTTSEDLGIYYKTNITIGDDLVNLIDSYGVALSLFDMPTAEDILAVGGHALYTVVDNNLVAGENTVTSGLLNNILKKEYTEDELETAGVETVAAANTKRGEMTVYANAYIAIDLDGDEKEEFVMANLEYNEIEHSLKSLMGKVDAMETIPQAAINCYKAWAPVGMDQWALTNLAAAAAVAE